ncbi:MAG: peptidase M15 [Gammaproteobacteria bacterium]|nr:peptidase M15 [Gammaproteobacteria bacterium]
MSLRIASGFSFTLLSLLFCVEVVATPADDFVELAFVIPEIRQEIRYFTKDNFVGVAIDGYKAPKCLLSKATAEALRKVQNELKKSGLGLKVFDCYRPQRAVDHFVRWAEDLNDKKMKPKYYPDVAKKDLFKKGYIAEKSGHSRGSTVDLTLIFLDSESAVELDMGSAWDFFGLESWPENRQIKSEQFDNRMLLNRLMVKHGFSGIKEEWWHFTLRQEPFPQTYFDFIIE